MYHSVDIANWSGSLGNADAFFASGAPAWSAYFLGLYRFVFRRARAETVRELAERVLEWKGAGPSPGEVWRRAFTRALRREDLNAIIAAMQLAHQRV